MIAIIRRLSSTHAGTYEDATALASFDSEIYAGIRDRARRGREGELADAIQDAQSSCGKVVLSIEISRRTDRHCVNPHSDEDRQNVNSGTPGGQIGEKLINRVAQRGLDSQPGHGNAPHTHSEVLGATAACTSWRFVRSESM